MKTKTTAAMFLGAALVATSAQAWGPGDTGGGEPPGPNATFEQWAQPSCLTAGDFWGQLAPELTCGYVPPIKPPVGWQPPQVPTPPVPEPSALWLALVGLAVVAWRARR